jgi:hypothetical protein
MSAFDSAMLMIEDLTKQVVELEQQVWDLEIASWHVARTFKDPKDGITFYQNCNCPLYTLTAYEACTLKKAR